MDAVTFITKLQKFIRDSYQNLLNKKEQSDEKGNVIDLGKGSTKDKPRS
jgi:hypothetical protein